MSSYWQDPVNAEAERAAYAVVAADLAEWLVAHGFTGWSVQVDPSHARERGMVPVIVRHADQAERGMAISKVDLLAFPISTRSREHVFLTLQRLMDR